MRTSDDLIIKDKHKKTWTKKRIGIVIVVAVAYGSWFNFLDSAGHCKDPINNKDCIAAGEIFQIKIGSQTLQSNAIYQPWNIIGHCIPGLFMLLLKPKKLELFIAGILISSVVMDSPLWGGMKLWHNLPLWHVEGKNNFATTTSFVTWVADYYNPFGKNPVWEASWPFAGLPTSAMIFWSLVARIAAAGGLIWLQERQEALGKEFSLKQLLLLRR